MAAEIIRLPDEPSAIAEAAAVLARAFHQDPLCVFMVPNADERQRVLPKYFQKLVLWGLMFGEVFATAGEITGVAVWISPDEPADAAERSRRVAWHELSAIVGADVVRRVRSVVGHERQVHDRDFPDPHWYLAQLGVDPEFQGRAIGGALMRPVTDKAAKSGLVCYLETENPTNPKFYKRHGFELVREEIAPESGMKFWTMVRRPPSAP